MTSADAEDTRQRGRVRRTWSSRLPQHFLEAYAMVFLTMAVAVFFTFYGPTSNTFLTSGNLQVVVGGQSVLAIVALAALVPLICEEFDLSVGAIAGVTSVFCASALSAGWPLPVALIAPAALGTLVGVLNALIITKLGVNSLITTLGTAAILAGVVTQKTGGLAVVSDIPDSVVSFGSGTWLGIPRPAYALLLVALFVYYGLNHTPIGRYVHALGSNREAARLVGLRSNFLLATTFIVSGTLAGVAGVLQVARSGGADPRVGELFTLPAIAAAFLSAAAIKPGRYNVGGTLVAIFFLAILNSGLNLAGAQPYVSQYVNGVALIVGIGLAVYLGRERLEAS